MKLGNTVLGPYKFLKMLKLIKIGDLREYDLVRKRGERDWRVAHSIFEFSKDYLGKIDDPIVKELVERNIFRRRQNRKDFRGSVSVFDGKELYHLEGADLSFGGIAFFSDGQMYAVRGAESHTHTALGAYETDRWYHVKTVVDLGRRRFDAPQCPRVARHQNACRHPASPRRQSGV